MEFPCWRSLPDLVREPLGCRVDHKVRFVLPEEGTRRGRISKVQFAKAVPGPEMGTRIKALAESLFL